MSKNQLVTDRPLNFKKLFFLRENLKLNRQKNIKTKPHLIKIKLAVSKIIDHPHNLQPQFNFLDFFFNGNSNENRATLLIDNPLLQNFLLKTPENI